MIYAQSLSAPTVMHVMSAAIMTMDFAALRTDAAALSEPAADVHAVTDHHWDAQMTVAIAIVTVY